MKLKMKNNIEPSCSYCAHGLLSPTGEGVLCVKMGIMDFSSFCKRFLYDPLKRQPQKTPLLPKFNESDFAL